jgi:hypothetical protein
MLREISKICTTSGLASQISLLMPAKVRIIPVMMMEKDTEKPIIKDPVLWEAQPTTLQATVVSILLRLQPPLWRRPL